MKSADHILFKAKFYELVCITEMLSDFLVVVPELFLFDNMSLRETLPFPRHYRHKEVIAAVGPATNENSQYKQTLSI